MILMTHFPKVTFQFYMYIHTHKSYLKKTFVNKHTIQLNTNKGYICIKIRDNDNDGDSYWFVNY